MLANISCYAPSILAEIFFFLRRRPRTVYGHCCGRVQSTDMKAAILEGEKGLQSSMEKRENAALLSKQETTSSLEDRACEEARETEKR